MSTQPIYLDARGLRCPIPALRLARAVREHGHGSYVLYADDPAARIDIPALCRERGWRLAGITEDQFAIEA